MNLPLITDWLHVGPTMATAFLASTVEAVEAMTVVLAAAIVRIAPALAGSLAALAVLAIIVAVFGSAIAAIPRSPPGRRRTLLPFESGGPRASAPRRDRLAR